MFRRINRRPRRYGTGGVDAVEMTLDLAEILSARDDFLAGVTAFVEADRTQFVEVGHLRHEGLFRRIGNQRNTGLDIEPLPNRSACRTGHCGKLRPQDCRRYAGHDYDQACAVKTNDCAAGKGRCFQHAGRYGQTGIEQGRLGLWAG